MSYPFILVPHYYRLICIMASLLLLHGILDANKLIRSNYVDGLRNLRIILTQKKISYILDTPAPDMLDEDAIEEKMAIYKM